MAPPPNRVYQCCCSPCPRFHVLGQEAMELHNPRSGRLALRSSTTNCFGVTGVTGVPKPDAGLARRSTTTPHIPEAGWWQKWWDSWAWIFGHHISCMYTNALSIRNQCAPKHAPLATSDTRAEPISRVSKNVETTHHSSYRGKSARQGCSEPGECNHGCHLFGVRRNWDSNFG